MTKRRSRRSRNTRFASCCLSLFSPPSHFTTHRRSQSKLRNLFSYVLVKHFFSLSYLWLREESVCVAAKRAAIRKRLLGQSLSLLLGPVEGADCACAFGREEADDRFEHGAHAPSRLPALFVVSGDGETDFSANLKAAILGQKDNVWGLEGVFCWQ